MIANPSQYRSTRHLKDQDRKRWVGSCRVTFVFPIPRRRTLQPSWDTSMPQHYPHLISSRGNYCVCDHWFSSLPLGTQANRLMAMAGESTLLDNSGALLPDQQLVYDWLTQHQISWCAYQSGDFLPFFTLMARLVPEIATSLTLSQIGGKGRFRRYSQLKSEWNSSDTMPNVVFIEPEYTDGPHDTPNDDHAPTGVQPGQAFLADLYATLISNPARWAKTMLVVTYDEHGGFFDHVPPFEIPITINGVTLPTTGVRVPAFVVSTLRLGGICISREPGPHFASSAARRPVCYWRRILGCSE